MIHVCYALSDSDGHYSKFTGTSIASIFQNTKSSVTIHLLHDDTLTSDNYKKFVLLSNQFSQKIVFYNIGQIAKDLWHTLNNTFHNIEHSGHLNIATMYRLLVTDILPSSIEKLIYFDADIIVNMDISKFYEESLSENGNTYYLAATIDEPIQMNPSLSRLCQAGILSPNNYFNAGVLLMDLTRIRQEYPNYEIIKKGIAFCNRYPANFADQDILNYVFQSKYRKLPLVYNIRVLLERLKKRNSLESGIYHFAGGAFHLDLINDCYSKLFFHYLLMTPWFDENTIERLIALSKQRYLEKFSFFLLKTVSSFRNRHRVFISSSNSEALIRDKFSVLSEDNFIICDARNHSISIDLNQKDNFYIFFISNYAEIKNSLLRHNLVEWTDFMDGTFLLKPERVLSKWKEESYPQNLDDYYIIRDV